MKLASVIFALILMSAASAQNLKDNLLLFYQFNNNTLDQSDNGYDGTPFGMTYTEDRFGNKNSAASFDGVNDYLNFPNLDELKPDLPVSFSFWIKYESDSFFDRAVFNTSFEENVNSGVYLSSASALNTYAIGYGDGSPFYDNSSRRSLRSNTEIITGEWVHLTAVISGPNDIQVYINCLDNGGNYSGSGGELAYSDLPGCIGRHDQNTGAVEAYYFNGAIDDFRYWSRALTEAEILQLCNLSSFECPDFKANIGEPCEMEGQTGILNSFCECILETDTTQSLECLISVPNVFSPNGDGRNDRFIPNIDCELADYEMNIFNRWGNRIFHTTDSTVGWNGRNSKQQISPGVYFYTIRYSPESDIPRAISGTITLLE